MSARPLARGARGALVTRAARLFALALGVAALTGSGLACGGDPEACPAPAELELSALPSAPVTAEEVALILERSCALGGCHLSGPGAGGLVLGRASGAWRAALVDVPSHQHPGMPLITPGDPDRSWLVAKLTGAFCGASCDRALGCGGPMPPGAPLSAEDRAIIIGWIADGAP